MTDAHFNELAGRSEGVGRALMLLISMLEGKDMINGPHYCAALREMANGLKFSGDHLLATKHTMQETAEALDDARRLRRKSARPT